jgi:hypothetical protein
MLSLLNFGDSPFRALFYLVIGIFCAVIIANLLAFLIAQGIDLKTKKVRRSK